MAKVWKIVVFIGIQCLLGKRGSYPYGLMVGFGLYQITLLVIANDIIQTLLLLNSFEYLSGRIAWMNKRRYTCEPEKQEASGKKWRKKLEKWGAPGLIAVAALPYGGGALTGSILAISMRLEKRRAFWFIIAGCIIGSLIFYFGFIGIQSVLE